MNYTNCEVDKLEPTGRGGTSIQLSGGWTGNALFTGKDKDRNVVSLPKEVVVGATIECEIETVNTKGGTGTWNAIHFPKYTQQPSQQAAGGKSSGWTGGSREDIELKLTSFAMSYAKDLYMSTPESELNGMFETADKILDKMPPPVISSI